MTAPTGAVQDADIVTVVNGDEYKYAYPPDQGGMPCIGPLALTALTRKASVV